MFRITALAARLSEKNIFKTFTIHPQKVAKPSQLSHKNVVTSASKKFNVIPIRVSITIIYSFTCRKIVLKIKRS